MCIIMNMDRSGEGRWWRFEKAGMDASEDKKFLYIHWLIIIKIEPL